MDSLDVRILRAYLADGSRSPLTPEFRSSVAAVAERVGIDEETARYRLMRLRDSGFIADWRLYVNPHVWGGGQIAVWIDMDPAAPKRDRVEKLRLVPGVLFVHAMYDRLVAFVEHEEDASLPQTIGLIRSLAGVADPFVARVAFPPCRTDLSARDWDLVRALRTEPRQTYAGLAARLGLASRTIRVRLSKLTEQNAMFAWPSLNLRAVRGGVLIHLMVWYPGERKAEVDATVTAHLDQSLWHILHLLPYRADDLWPCSYNLLLPSVAAARDVVEWARGVPGVARAHFEVHEDIYNFFDAYDEILDRRLRRLPTAIPGSASRRTRRARAVRGSA